MKDLTKIKAESQCTHHVLFMSNTNMKCAWCGFIITNEPIGILRIWLAVLWAYWWMLKQKVKLWLAK